MDKGKNAEKLRLVIDTNIILSAVMQNSLTRQILLKKLFVLSCPQQLIEEVHDNSFELAKRTSISQKSFLELFEFIFIEAEIQQKNHEEYLPFAEVAKSICPKGHEDDWPFLALCIKENCAFWSNDKALRQQKIVKIVSTVELANMLKNI